jgi:hypothetical protein
VGFVVGLHATGQVTELAVGAGDQHRAHAFRGVLGEDAARRRRLVVGMSMHRHQGERIVGHGQDMMPQAHA